MSEFALLIIVTFILMFRLLFAFVGKSQREMPAFRQKAANHGITAGHGVHCRR